MENEARQNFYRFKGDLEPKESTSFPVTEERDSYTTVLLENFDLFALVELNWALEQNYIDEKFIEYLQELVKRREEIFVRSSAQ